LTGAAAATGAGADGGGAACCAGAGAGALGVAAGGGAGFEALYDGWLLSHAASANGASSSRDGLMNFMDGLRVWNCVGSGVFLAPANGSFDNEAQAESSIVRTPARQSGAAIGPAAIIRRNGARMP
jgi:hypothetical protein